MAEGTRRAVDERLTSHEERMDEFQESLNRMEEMMADMKSLLVDNGKGRESEQHTVSRSSTLRSAAETTPGLQIGMNFIGVSSSPVNQAGGSGIHSSTQSTFGISENVFADVGNLEHCTKYLNQNLVTFGFPASLDLFANDPVSIARTCNCVYSVAAAAAMGY